MWLNYTVYRLRTVSSIVGELQRTKMYEKGTGRVNVNGWAVTSHPTVYLSSGGPGGYSET